MATAAARAEAIAAVSGLAGRVTAITAAHDLKVADAGQKGQCNRLHLGTSGSHVRCLQHARLPWCDL
jgi:hypothetical protein